jgi:hypothetical protein
MSRTLRSGQAGNSHRLLFDLSRLAGLTALLLLATPPAHATATFDPADVFEISCGSTPLAHFVPLQGYRSALVEYAFTKRPPFATFAFHGSKANMLANWTQLVDRMKEHGIGECASGALTYRQHDKAYDIIERTHEAMRPAGVRKTVDHMPVDTLVNFNHAEMAFMEARGQAFLMDAANAENYDPAFSSRRVIGAVLFVLEGHILRAKKETPRLYRWTGTAYSYDTASVSFVTRENLASEPIRARLLGMLGANLPLPKTIPSSAASVAAPSAWSAASRAAPLPPPMISASAEDPTYSAETAVDATPNATGIELRTSPRFVSGGRDCAQYKTYLDLQACFDNGSAILLSSPAAKQTDTGFSPAVLGAIVYPRADWREAVVVRWDALLDEYVDAGYTENGPADGICRTCLWNPHIQAKIRQAVAPTFLAVRQLNTLDYVTEDYPFSMRHEGAARLLQRFPDDCTGLVAQGEDAFADEGFTPPISAVACRAAGVTRLWAYESTDDGPNYGLFYVIEDGTPERYFNARVAAALGIDRHTRFSSVRPDDTEGAAAAAEARRQQEEREHAELRAGIDRSLQEGAGAALTVGKWTIAIAAPILALLAVLLALQFRARRRRRAARHAVIAKAQAEYQSIDQLAAEAQRRLDDDRRFRADVDRRTAKILEEARRR